MECMVSLANSVSSDLVFDLYTKENAPKFCQMLYVALEIAKQEQLRSLRVKSIECILSIAKVLDDEDFNDVVVRNQVAEVFLYFIPGIASGLKSIATEDEKVGHKVPVVSKSHLLKTSNKYNLNIIYIVQYVIKVVSKIGG